MIKARIMKERCLDDAMVQVIESAATEAEGRRRGAIQAEEVTLPTGRGPVNITGKEKWRWEERN